MQFMVTVNQRNPIPVYLAKSEQIVHRVCTYQSVHRPLSILSSFSKVLEKVMYNQLQEHLSKYGILAEEQFGF